MNIFYRLKFIAMNILVFIRQIEKLFALKPGLDLKDAAILDYYVGAAFWAKQQGFDSLQLAGFFTVAHQLLYKIKGNRLLNLCLFKPYI